MERIPNPEMDRLILDHLADLYSIKRKREGIHLSTLIYCLTRSFFDQLAPVEPTDMEVMLFSLGYGLQDVLTPKEAVTPVYEKDGITFSPDFQLNLVGQKKVTMSEMVTVELKTTRMSSNKEEFPETWLEYIMGGCYIRGINEYELSILHMLGNYRPPFPEIKSYKLIFEDEELRDNWDYLLSRKAIYEEALRTKKPPVPFTYCKDWECARCRYKLQCEAIQMVAQVDTGQAEQDVRELWSKE